MASNEMKTGSMYFASRDQAGKLLAEKLAADYRYENCAVVALSDSSVMVAAEIAISLHSVLTMLMSSPIVLPREPNALAAVSQEGTLTYNQEYSTGDLEELREEYRNLIDQQRFQLTHEMNRLIGDGGLISKDLLKGHNVILVSDGLKSGFSLDVAADFLKPISIEKLIIATPIASVPAVDHMHIMADEIVCLSVASDYIETDHYYETNDQPDHEAVIAMIKSVILNWK
ncbi:MAG: phosphoribosyltransferase [Candidatus Saccharimonadales bacterium]